MSVNNNPQQNVRDSYSDLKTDLDTSKAKAKELRIKEGTFKGRLVKKVKYAATRFANLFRGIDKQKPLVFGSKKAFKHSVKQIKDFITGMNEALSTESEKLLSEGKYQENFELKQFAAHMVRKAVKQLKHAAVTDKEKNEVRALRQDLKVDANALEDAAEMDLLRGVMKRVEQFQEKLNDEYPDTHMRTNFDRMRSNGILMAMQGHLAFCVPSNINVHFSDGMRSEEHAVETKHFQNRDRFIMELEKYGNSLGFVHEDDKHDFMAFIKEARIAYDDIRKNAHSETALELSNSYKAPTS